MIVILLIKVAKSQILEHNSPSSIQKRNNNEIFSSVSLALNDDQNETDYLPPRGNLKTVGLGLVI